MHEHGDEGKHLPTVKLLMINECLVVPRVPNEWMNEYINKCVIVFDLMDECVVFSLFLCQFDLVCVCDR